MDLERQTMATQAAQSIKLSTTEAGKQYQVVFCLPQGNFGAHEAVKDMRVSAAGGSFINGLTAHCASRRILES